MWGAESFIRRVGGGAGGGGGAAAAAAAAVVAQQHLGSKSAPCSPVKPFLKRAPAQPDSFHVIHKVPLGDSPYVKAKHVQLVDKDPDAAIALFWAAINAGDRVDSALKDMAIVMKQQNRPEEAIEAIKSLRYRCSDAAQESLDNVLLDLYKRCGRLDDQIALLKHKLHLIHQGMAFNGKRTKTARSQGKKFQVSIEQESTRLLGNLGWAYMQQSNFLAAEAVYRKALSIGPDNNKVCNLGICLMKQGRLEEARAMLQSVVPACPDTRWGSDSHLKSYERAQEMLVELETSMGSSATETQIPSLAPWLAQTQGTAAAHHRQKSSNTEEFSLETIAQFSLPSLAGALSATAGFGPSTNAGPTSGTQKKSSTTTSSSLGYQQQLQERPASHDGGRPAGGASNAQFGRNHHRRSSSYQWDEYDLGGYTSPDENVDTNVQQGGMGNAAAHLGFNQQNIQAGQQHVQWPGEGPRQKQESLGARKLERSLTFGGALSRMDSNSYSSNNSSNLSYQGGSGSMHRAASENFSGRISSAASPMKPSNSASSHQTGERAPLTTYDRTNSVTTYAAAAAAAAAAATAAAAPTARLDEGGIRGAANQITSGWGNAGAATHHQNSNLVLDLMMGSNGAGAPLKSPMGNSELSFFSRWGYNENNHNRPVTRRSLSLESFDTQLEQIALENEELVDAEIAFPPPPLPAYLQLNLHPPQPPVSSAAAAAVTGHVKRPRNQTPIKEKNSNSNSLWNSLGFTLCPDALNGGSGLKLGLGLGLGLDQQQQSQQPHYDSEEIRHMNTLVSQVVSDGTASPAASRGPAGALPTPAPELQAIVQKIEQQQQSMNVSSATASAALGPTPFGTTENGGAAISVSGSEAEMIKRQRRLRVFQEITLFPGSPQHIVGV